MIQLQAAFYTFQNIKILYEAKFYKLNFHGKSTCKTRAVTVYLLLSHFSMHKTKTFPQISSHSLEHLRFLAGWWGRGKYRDLTSSRPCAQRQACRGPFCVWFPRPSYACVEFRLLGSLSDFNRMNLLMKIWSGEHLSWRCTADARCSSDDEGSCAESSIYCPCTVHFQQQYPLTDTTFRLQANEAQMCFFLPVCQFGPDLTNTV